MGRRKNCTSKVKRLNGDEGMLRDAELPSTVADATTLPYKIQQSDVMGRYLTARKNLGAGEIIMTDEPIVVGPCQESKPVCIGCYADIDLSDDKSYKRCGKCTWPLCSAMCPNSHARSEPGENSYVGHTTRECDFLASSAVREADPSTLKTCFYAITPLRLLMVKLHDPEMWEIVRGMEAHTEKRKENELLWRTNSEMVVDKLRHVFGLSMFDPEEIHFACGVLEVNAFEVTPKEGMQPVRAIYPRAYLFSHDCVPNTSHSNGDAYSLIVRTNKIVSAGAALTVSYTYTLQSTLKRRKHLLDTKFFACCCERCKDVTELGQYCSALKCPKCKVGVVLPMNPLDEDSEWECNCRKCPGYRASASTIISAEERLSKELDSIDGNDVAGYELFLGKYSGSLIHENHHLCLAALHSLSQIYGKTTGYIIDQLTQEQLDRKIEICRKLLKIFERLEPGLSKQRGILLYELQAALMIRLTRRVDDGNIPIKEMRQKVREVIKCLEETRVIFSTEWKYSPEGRIADAAKDALATISNSISNLL